MKPRGIYLEIFRISFHNLRLSQTQVVTILRARAKQEEPYLEWSIIQDIDGGIPTMSRPTFE